MTAKKRRPPTTDEISETISPFKSAFCTKLQRAETYRELRSLSRKYVKAIEAGVGREVKTLRSPWTREDEAGGECRVVEDVYVFVRDYERPVALHYFEYDAGTMEGRGGDIDIL